MAELSMVCARHVEASSDAREWLVTYFGDRLESLVLETVQLIVSELVSNAVQHADGEITLCVAEHGRRLRIEVTDESPECEAVIIPLDPLGTNGRGLRIVEAFSRSWGCDRERRQKVVWAELEVTPG